MLELLDLQAREDLEKLLLEHHYIADIATRNSAAKRKISEEHTWRTAFEHDRDRIRWSPCFRKLAQKTQVFLLPGSPLLSTRLTHSIFVEQIAEGIASYLKLNIPLTRAIALGHDIGHVPFGHSGEPVLTNLMGGALGDDSFGFHHTWYGVRVLNDLEREGRGYNLTEQVNDGILCHSKGKGRMDKGRWASTPEGRVVMYSDKIAYVFMDIQDGLEAQVIDEDDLPKEIDLFGKTIARRVGKAIHDVVQCSLEAINGSDPSVNVCWHGESYETFERIKRWNYDNVYGVGPMEKEFSKAKWLMARVFEHIYERQPSTMHSEESAWNTLDAVAGMTDYTIMKYTKDNLLPRSVF